MAKSYRHTKGFLMITMSWNEAQSLGFGIPGVGCICTTCNSAETKDIYYLAALNETMCNTCLQEFLADSTWYPEDHEIELRNFKFYADKLGIGDEVPTEFKLLTEEGPA